MDRANLRQRWAELTQRLSGEVWNVGYIALEALYAYPVRAYHNLDHIAVCLSCFDAYRTMAEDSDAVELALWVHDCIYDATRKDNERLSADIGAMVGRELGLPAWRVTRIEDLVMATTHSSVALESDRALIADIDLSSLALPSVQFDRDSANIRTEYSHVADEDFYRGRANFLDGLAKRPFIYQTLPFQTAFESLARDNIRRGLDAAQSWLLASGSSN